MPLRRVAPRHVERIRAKFSIPDPPEYTFEAAGGVEVSKPHDETTLETPEDHRAWNEHQSERNRILSEQNIEVARFLIFHCIAEDPPPVEEWSVNWKMWGIDPPEDSDPVDFKAEWVESELVPDRDDYAGLMSALYQMGGQIGPDQAREFETFFRVTLERLGLG